MKVQRRRFLQFATGAAALGAAARLAWAQTYPTRPVRIIVGFGPGGPVDILARLMGQWLSERLSQQFVIENRPGAATNIATEAVVRAPPDGYTLLMIGSWDAYNATLYRKVDFNFIRDIAPVASIARGWSIMEVNPSFPAKTLTEFLAYAKANPGKINVGAIAGGSTHLYGELFKMMAGVDMATVYYRGLAPALTDLIAGQIDVMFDSVASSIDKNRRRRVYGNETCRTNRSRTVGLRSLRSSSPGAQRLSRRRSPLAIEAMVLRLRQTVGSGRIILRSRRALRRCRLRPPKR